MKSITNQYIKNNTFHIFGFSNNCRVLIEHTELFTKSSVTMNYLKNSVNQLKHFLQCEDCQNSLKKYVHDIDEYINQLEMTDDNFLKLKTTCVNDKSEK